MSSSFIAHIPCPDCGSRDNLAIYDDGHGFCHTSGCGWKKPEDGEYVGGHAVKKSGKRKQVNKDLDTDLMIRSIRSRKLTEETCRKFGYGYSGAVQVASYYKNGSLVAQHCRDADKSFWWSGDSKGVELFGQHLWAVGGKMVVVTEGEIDCLSVSQLQGNKWPVVSIPSGAGAAKKALQDNLEWLEGFQKVILMFDMDQPGKDAVEACAPLFSPGKCRVATLPMKDANECLVAGCGDKVIEAMWNAREWRPDGIVELADIIDEAEKPAERGLAWFLDGLTRETYGRRYGEIYALGAGTGVGKTDFLTQQIAFDVMELGQHVGVIFLEQRPVETAKRIAGKVAGKRFHVPGSGWDREELRENLNKLSGKITFYDNWGATDWDIVARNIRFMFHSQGIRMCYLDHLTALADTASERESLEQIMKEMAALANELQIIILFVSHLTTPEGKPHEEGGRVAIRHFKGSRAIGFWSHFMFGLERNQQAEDKDERHRTVFRVLKDRYTGQATGETFVLEYDSDTGLLTEGLFQHEDERSNYESTFGGDAPRF